MSEIIGQAAYELASNLDATVGEYNLTVDVFTATASQTVFNLTGGKTYDNTKPAFVFVGGVIQTATGGVGDNFTRTNTSRFTMSAGVNEGTKVVFIGQSSEAAGRMLYGAGAPDDGDGNNGDFYLNTTNEDFYQKAAGTWGSAITNFKGDKGDTGDAVVVKKAGTPVGTRAGINFIEGTNVTLTVSDDAGNNEVDVTITAAGGSGHTIQEEGTPLTARAALNFVGTGVAATDDSGNDATVVTINSDVMTPVSTYTHTANTVITVSAVDVDTDTFTSVAHGLANNNEIYITINSDAGNVYPLNVYPGGVTAVNKYFVVNKTDDTFQISTTSGGAAVNLTTNANLDVTKWHFEKAVTSNITISGLPSKQRYRVKITGKSLLQSASSYVMPNSIGVAQEWLGSSYNFPIVTLNDIWTVLNLSYDYTNILTIFQNGVICRTNNTTTNTTTVVANAILSPKYVNGNITQFVIANHVFANGTKIEVYNY